MLIFTNPYKQHFQEFEDINGIRTVENKGLS